MNMVKERILLFDEHCLNFTATVHLPAPFLIRP